MTATVHPIPTATHALSLARQVSRNHVCYETLDLIAARSVLLDCGAGPDMQVAEMLRHVIGDRTDTPRANRLADAVTMFVLGSAGLMLLAMWWMA